MSGPRTAVAVAAVLVVGLVLGGAMAITLRAVDDEGGLDEVGGATTTTAAPPVPLLDALAVAGVPEPVATCAAATLTDQSRAVQEAVARQPLAAGGPGREVVAACALEHLADEVESSTGIAGTDASCVAGGVLDRLGLEAALASIGALAVTAEVAAAATAAAEACAAAG